MYKDEAEIKAIIKGKVLEVIQRLGKDSDEGNSGSVLVDIQDDVALESIGLDSISYITLLVELEEELDIEFEDEDLVIDNFRNINAILSLVKERIGCE